MPARPPHGVARPLGHPPSLIGAANQISLLLMTAAAKFTRVGQSIRVVFLGRGAEGGEDK